MSPHPSTPGPDPDPDLDALQTLSRREPILSLLADGPRRKRDLVDELTVSRSTVDRAIRELEYFEFVERCDGRYRLTVAGRLALTEHRRRATALDSIATVSDLLGYVPRNAPMSVRMLDGATVHEPKPHAPNEPFEVILDRMTDAERFRGLAAAERVPQFRSQLYDRTVNGDLEAEAVFTDELAGFFFRTHPQQLHDIMDVGGVDLYATPSVPYGLWIVDTTEPDRTETFVVVHGDSADIRGVIQNDTTAALEWAESVYRDVREDAQRLKPPN